MAAKQVQAKTIKTYKRILGKQPVIHNHTRGHMFLSHNSTHTQKKWFDNCFRASNTRFSFSFWIFSPFWWQRWRKTSSNSLDLTLLWQFYFFMFFRSDKGKNYFCQTFLTFTLLFHHSLVAKSAPICRRQYLAEVVYPGVQRQSLFWTQVVVQSPAVLITDARPA